MRLKSRAIILGLALLTLAACAKKSDQAPTITTRNDSLLVAPKAPLTDSQRITRDSAGRVIDLTQNPPEQRKALLKRFEPKRLVEIYDDFRPYRHAGTRQSTVDSFDRTHRITEAELRAVLAEGDDLGWSGGR